MSYAEGQQAIDLLLRYSRRYNRPLTMHRRRHLVRVLASACGRAYAE